MNFRRPLFRRINSNILYYIDQVAIYRPYIYIEIVLVNAIYIQCNRAWIAATQFRRKCTIVWARPMGTEIRVSPNRYLIQRYWLVMGARVMISRTHTRTHTRAHSHINSKRIFNATPSYSFYLYLPLSLPLSLYIYMHNSTRSLQLVCTPICTLISHTLYTRNICPPPRYHWVFTKWCAKITLRGLL